MIKQTHSVYTVDTAILYPGKSSQAGFLNDGETLEEIVEADRQTLENLGLTYKQFTDRLTTLMEKTRRHRYCRLQNGDPDAPWEDVTVEGRYLVQSVSYMGYQFCPWGCKATSDSDFTVKNLSSGEKVFFSQLHPHLIQEHHFFEGHTGYRLDPCAAAKVLDVESGRDYSPQYVSKEYWVAGSGGCGGHKNLDDYEKGAWQDEAKNIIKNGKKFSIGVENTRCWIKNDTLYIISLNAPDWSESLKIQHTPVRTLVYGGYLYKKQTLKWVEDNHTP
jgi:hypothetical protein